MLLLAEEIDIATVREAYSYGCVDFLRKPIANDELQIRVDRALQLHSARESTEQLITELRERSERDPLTLLYNRRAFHDHGLREIVKSRRTGAPLALLMIDVDKFKKINDTHSHTDGDRVLVELAMLLKAHLRQYDVIVRYGGDEFAVLLPSTTAAEAEKVANKLCHLIANRFNTEKWAFTVSIGVAEYCPEEPTTLQEELSMLVSAADAALYTSKTTGRNRVSTFKKDNQTTSPGAHA